MDTYGMLSYAIVDPGKLGMRYKSNFIGSINAYYPFDTVSFDLYIN